MIKPSRKKRITKKPPFIWIYMTAANRKEADKLGTQMVKNRLAGCVNIVDRVHSIYRWQGKIEKSNECILFLKTRGVLWPPLLRWIRENHSYSVPCILKFDMSDLNPAYAAWLRDQTKL